MMKTPVTVLQELMTQHREEPHYECISNTGPDHLKLFEYCCRARDVSASGSGRTKKEAKQEAARRALALLAARGLRVPPPYHAPPAPDTDDPLRPPRPPLPSCSADEAGEAGGGGVGAGCAGGAGGAGARPDARSYVALLKELCEQYKLASVQYELVGDTGPAHLRQFTVRARLGELARAAHAPTKKAARQLAAERLYAYLRENLAAVTKDFVEEEALSRALDKALQRYEAASVEAPWRPDLTQRLADFHLGPEQRAKGEAALEAGAELEAAARALGLAVERSRLPADGGALSLVALAPSAPALVFAGRSRAAADRAATRYLRRAFAFPALSTPQ